MNNLNLEAYIEIKDLLGATGPVTVDGFDLDAVVNVVVVQTGTNSLVVDQFEVDGGVVDAIDDSPSIVYLNYEAQCGSEISKTMDNFTKEVKRLAVEYARNSDEDKWSYRITPDQV
jgi:hypothetical protein